MISRYVVYLIETGEILRGGIAPEQMIAEQAFNPGEGAVPVGEGVSAETHHIVNETVVLK